MKEDVTVRVGESTTTLRLLGGFRNSALSRIGNFPALVIGPYSVWWTVPGPLDSGYANIPVPVPIGGSRGEQAQ